MTEKDRTTGFWEPGLSVFADELGKEESRRLADLQAGDTLAVVVFTEPDAETVRIISVRKANRHEQNIYATEIRD
jgi:uncharacterized DUF497 family protein